MSSLSILVSELQSLASETRRKHPDVREAADKSIAILRGAPDPSSIILTLSTDGPQSTELLRPVFLACATKNPKVVAIAMGSLQRLIQFKAVPPSAVHQIVNTMNDCVGQGVDIQLRILQTILALVTNFPSVHGDLLGDALLLCFKLQESRIAVVSSTAAATLRQLVMFVMDKVVHEDDQDDPQQPVPTTLPDGSTMQLLPSSRDAFSVFEDLCLLANSDRPRFLRLDQLHKTFALELIESVLTNYHTLFHRHAELLTLLPHHLCPLLLKCLSERPALFPLALRATRVVFLILKQFSSQLTAESEIFLMLLVKVVGAEESAASSEGPRPPWMRVLAMEILRGVCADAELMRTLFTLHDQQASSQIFTALLGTLNRLASEKPVLLGTYPQLQTGSALVGDEAYGTAVAGMVSATVTGMVGMLAGGEAIHGLSAESSMRLQCIDQLDKAEAPIIPETYIYLLALQSLTALSNGFSTSVLPVYNSIIVAESENGVPPAPPALNIGSLPESTAPSGAGILRTTHAMLEAGWPALLAAHTFLISTNLSAPLFQDVLGAIGAIAQTCGVLGLSMPRDAFLGALSKLAIPAKVVSSLDAHPGNEVATPRSSVFADFSASLAGAGAVSTTPGLGERNLACLKLFIACAMHLAGSLGASWYTVLEALQNADYVLQHRALRPGAPPRKGSITAGGGGQIVEQTAVTLQQLEAEADVVLGAIQRLFESSKGFDDTAFHYFVQALARLSAEMVAMQAGGAGIAAIAEEPEDDASYASPASTMHPENVFQRRRVSGMHISKTQRSGDFGITKISLVAQLNLHRLVYRSPDVAWDPITSHLLGTLLNPTAPASIRNQAADTLDAVLAAAPRNVTMSSEDVRTAVQGRVLDVLSKQVTYGNDGPLTSTTASGLRGKGLDTLKTILQTTGHTLLTGWETIFEMLDSVCKPIWAPATPLTTTSEISMNNSPVLSPIKGRGQAFTASEKADERLVRTAFQSLTIVCDHLALLSPDNLRLCITTIAHFGRQTDTNIALTSAASLLWTVSDSIQSKRMDPAVEPEYSVLWMLLLSELLGLCTDSRREVRAGAIQTLFRTLQLYGATLSGEIWHQCLWEVVFPVLDNITAAMRSSVASPSDSDPAADPIHAVDHWSDSKILALQSVGGIFHDFLISKIMSLDSFDKAWNVFVSHMRDSALLDHRTVSTAALRCLEKSVIAATSAEVDPYETQGRIVWNATWEAIDLVGHTIQTSSNSPKPKSPVTPRATAPSVAPFTQEALLALLDVLSATRIASKKFEHGQEWPLEQLSRTLAILKAILTYQCSPDYRPDIDALSPVQAAVFKLVESINLEVPSSPSLVLRDLADYATLPFLAAFDFEPPSLSSDPSASRTKTMKRVTYIAVSKRAMPWLVELYLRFKDTAQIYADGTLEAVVAAYSIPIKLKYDCPAPSKFGKDAPLWKTATTNFIQIVSNCAQRIKQLGEDISDEHVESLWRQIIDVFRGGLLADTSVTEGWPLDVQNAEEDFDHALVKTLELDVIPHSADKQVPETVIIELARVLQRASHLHETDDAPLTPPSDAASTLGKRKDKQHAVSALAIDRGVIGSTVPGRLLPRERWSYWCYDLLFLLCSGVNTDDEVARKRLTVLALPQLLRRCQEVLTSYVADDALRGNMPFPRAREEEILYTLRKLLTLELWAGSFTAAFSLNPSETAQDLPAIDATLPPSKLIAESVKRSSRAHLFHLYPVLCDIAAIPRKSVSVWTAITLSSVSPGDGDADVPVSKQLDARQLARTALEEIGKEMGMEM